MATKEVGPNTKTPVIIEILDDDEMLDIPAVAVKKPEEMLDNGGADVPAEDDSEDEGGEEGEWETDSFYEEAFEQMGDEQEFTGGNDACTREEAAAYIRLLRAVGEHEFIKQTLEAGVKAKKLMTAFGIPPPTWLDGAPDEAYYRFIGFGIERELQKRLKLPEYNTVDDAVALLKKSKNIIVLTGAGISTSLGIPDFRSKHTGLYSKLEYLGLSDPQEVFDIELFREDPTIFYSVAKDILPSTKKFSPTHAFIRLLQDKNRLLTNYTQNIDNLEGYAGIDSEKLIQCHGSFATASCQECKHQITGDAIFAEMKAGNVPRCSQCLYRMRQIRPAGFKRKRSSDHSRSRSRKKEKYEDSSSEDDLSQAAGIMKPDITFFGEGLPDKFGKRLIDHDKNAVDLVLVIGTSLKVAPVAEVPNLVKDVPQIYISRDPCKHIQFDIELMGECDVIVAELCRRAGWNFEHEMLPPNQIVDVQLADHQTSRWNFQASKKPEVPPLTGVFTSNRQKVNGATAATKFELACDEKPKNIRAV